ncbi:MAG: hypothetical protein CMI56_01615 [Parcubacteria group bacterium]|nr:hypothetical protein [Parcubacteria group bacterium]
MLGHWCSYDQLKFDRKQCEDGCLPAKDAGCDSANGPQEWAAKCQTYYDICKVLEYSPATTPPPYHQGTNNNWQSTTSEPYDQSKSNDASACGVGTKMEDGKCVINYSGLKEMCYMASKNNWGWTCKALSQCSAPSPFNN